MFSQINFKLNAAFKNKPTEQSQTAQRQHSTVINAANMCGNNLCTSMASCMGFRALWLGAFVEDVMVMH